MVKAENWVNLRDVVRTSTDRCGTVWALMESGDLNANLVCFPTGRGVGGHANDEVDVLLLGVSGSGSVAVDGEEHALSAGALIFVPRGAWRSTHSRSESFAYLSIHRRRGLLPIGSNKRS